MNRVQTDHSYFEEKVMIRMKGIPEKNPLKVLDMFSGNGLIWEEIQKRTGREILVLRIEREKGVNDRLNRATDDRRNGAT